MCFAERKREREREREGERERDRERQRETERETETETERVKRCFFMTFNIMKTFFFDINYFHVSKNQ